MAVSADTPLSGSHVAAWDPGQLTGYVEMYEGKILFSATYDYDQIIRMASDRDTKLIRVAPKWVVEDFKLYPWAAHKLSFDRIIPARVIGMIEVFARVSKATVEFQAASDAKTASVDSIIHHRGLTYKVHGKHEMDALRHAVCYLARKKGIGG